MWIKCFEFDPNTARHSLAITVVEDVFESKQWDAFEEKDLPKVGETVFIFFTEMSMLNRPELGLDSGHGRLAKITSIQPSQYRAGSFVVAFDWLDAAE